MCGICGCSDPQNAVTLINPETGESRLLRKGGLVSSKGGRRPNPDPHDDALAAHPPHAGDDQPHVHGPHGEVIQLEAAILSKNDTIAARNRGWFEGRQVLALNLVSSPGAGKTSLLERTIRDHPEGRNLCVIEGDQMTVNDAERIRAAGAQAVQINTGAACHLEADMIAEALTALKIAPGTMVMIENVGNLVCPSMFDLGERLKVAIISVTEGEDKPIKYPHMFRAAGCIVINKIDLAKAVEFDEAKCREHILSVNPKAQILTLSAKTGEGMREWFEFLTQMQRSI